MHKTANILNKLPKSLHTKARRALQEIWMAETKKDAVAALKAFVETYQVKYDKAADCLTKDRDALTPSTPMRSGTGRRELDGQRNAVQAPADCRDGRRNALVRREVRLRRAHPCDEQLNRAISQQILDILGTFGRHSERRHPVKALIRRSQRLAARRHHMCCRVGPQQCFGHARRGVDHMLAIIEHKQELLRAERTRDPFGCYRTAGDLEPERSSDGDRDKVGIGQRPELGDPHPVGKVGSQVTRDLEAQSRLPDASSSDQGDEPMSRQESGRLGELDLAANQLRGRRRKVR